MNTWPRRIYFGNVSAFPVSPLTLWRRAKAGWQQEALTAASRLQGRGQREGHGEGPTLPKACPEHPKQYRGAQQEPKYWQKERRGLTANRTWITFPKHTLKRKKQTKQPVRQGKHRPQDMPSRNTANSLATPKGAAREAKSQDRSRELPQTLSQIPGLPSSPPWWRLQIFHQMLALFT